MIHTQLCAAVKMGFFFQRLCNQLNISVHLLKAMLETILLGCTNGILVEDKAFVDMIKLRWYHT